MLAAWYERQGPAGAVLQVGELPDPRPGPGEVRVRLTRSGISPGDTKKRRGWLGSAMPYPRVVPHSDGTGTIDTVGAGVDPRRAGERVWVFNAQSYRASGSAAQYTVVPSASAIALPAVVSDELGACLGIPGITAHRAVFGDGPVAARTVLVHGVLGGVGSLAAQLAVWGGATVIGTVRRSSDLPQPVAGPAGGAREGGGPHSSGPDDAYAGRDTGGPDSDGGYFPSDGGNSDGGPQRYGRPGGAAGPDAGVPGASGGIAGPGKPGVGGARGGARSGTRGGSMPVVALDRPDAADAIRALAPDGVDRIVEVAFSDNVALDTAVARVGAVIAAYATRDDRPAFDFWPMLFANLTIRLLGSDDFPPEAKQHAAADLTTAAAAGALTVATTVLPLDRIAEAHDRVDAGTRTRILLAIP